MLFNSFDFIIFFAVVAVQYFRAPWLVRWSLTLAGIVFPVVQYGRTPQAIAACLFIVAAITLVNLLRVWYSQTMARKVLLVLASLLFYSAWRWPFTSLLLISTVEFATPLLKTRFPVGKNRHQRHLWHKYNMCG